MYNYSETNRVRWIKLQGITFGDMEWVNTDSIQRVVDNGSVIAVYFNGYSEPVCYKYDFDKVPELLIKRK
ncbi:hypothetical protein [Lentilactobacillus buchneri]|uniref:hypothetical protein n=1 Tax=Lentilactobacillus buchneri TaxID=1581 RepID=UPI0005C7FAA3|nr:hypothetical protein [Lentilactobacillus buchneri]MCT2901788.1 hypothetical protein [Lentilactobacillus buchneri]MCT3545104.1 hypothetical protein [Lentilactobacillus buchneri]